MICSRFPEIIDQQTTDGTLSILFTQFAYHPPAHLGRTAKFPVAIPDFWIRHSGHRPFNLNMPLELSLLLSPTTEPRAVNRTHLVALEFHLAVLLQPSQQVI
jgi:hypothetical protein